MCVMEGRFLLLILGVMRVLCGKWFGFILCMVIFWYCVFMIGKLLFGERKMVFGRRVMSMWDMIF